MKKTLSTILKERTDTIEFRAIRKKMMDAAQNSKAEIRQLRIEQKTIIMLQNNGINVEKINENGYDIYKCSW